MKRKMSRSTFLLGVGGTAALASLRLPSSGVAQTRRRNVLWVVDDDHPQYMMSPLPVTRHKIRDQGISFTSGSTDIPLCGPARVNLLTGLSGCSGCRGFAAPPVRTTGAIPQLANTQREGGSECPAHTSPRVRR